MSEEQKRFYEFLEKKVEEEQGFEMNEEDIETELDQVLPQIPGKPRVVQVNPPPYKMPRLLFGKWMPKKDDEDGKKKKKKKAAKKAP